MRSVTRASVLVGGAVTILVAAPLTTHGQSAPTPLQVAAVDAARLYESACATCHGRYGDGQGPGARALRSPQPRDFTAGVFKFRSTPTGSLPTDGDIYRSISRGVPGTWMPPWEDLLTPSQQWALVRYIKSFSEWFDEEEPDPPIEIPPAPPATPELIREGRMVYAVLKCWQCHGPLGRGDGPSAGVLFDDWDRKITPYDFTRGNYKNGSAPQDLYRTLVTGLNGSPMPAYERSNITFPGGPDTNVEPMRAAVSDAELRDLTAYLSEQPTAAALQGMSAADVDQLVQRRRWALIYYVRSLDRGKGPLYWLFGENPELQPRNGNR